MKALSRTLANKNSCGDMSEPAQQKHLISYSCMAVAVLRTSLDFRMRVHWTDASRTH